MSYRGLVDSDVEVIAELQEFLPYELGAVVGDDSVRHPEAVDDVAEETDRLL